MNIQTLRKAAKTPILVRWLESDVIESAVCLDNGAIKITNIISGQSYILPRYDLIRLEVFTGSHVALGRLLPKRMR